MKELKRLLVDQILFSSTFTQMNMAQKMDLIWPGLVSLFIIALKSELLLEKQIYMVIHICTAKLKCECVVV